MDAQENIQIPEKVPNPQANGPTLKSEPSLTDKISKDKPRELISLVKNGFSSFFATLPPKSKKIFKIAGGATAALLVLLIISSLVNGVRIRIQKEAPSPSPRAYATGSFEEILTPSRYAKDAGILKIKDDLENIDKDLGSMDIQETNLSLPRIDFNIKFDK